MKKLLIVLLMITIALPNFVGAQDDGIQLSGLDAEVNVYVDHAGVPHIYAETPHDLLMVQGYLHAQERWWQMEYFRHLGSGRMAELFGAEWVAQDTFIRTLGLNRNAERDLAALPDDTRVLLDAYVDGVNAYLDGKSPTEIAVEYEVLAANGIQIDEVEDWQAMDTIVWQQSMALRMSGTSLNVELISQAVFDEAGILGLNLILPPYPFDEHPVIMEPGRERATSQHNFETVGLNPLSTLSPLPQDYTWSTEGSNNWVVSGDLTDTGKPYLANDPHISDMMPGIWYQVGLHCLEVSDACPYDVAGFSFAGSPFIVIGHNRYIGWGMTNVGMDVFDTYMMELNPDNPHQYRYNDEWLDAEVITETIQVAKGDPVELDIRISQYGPILESLGGGQLDQPIAVTWILNKVENRTIEAMHQAIQATNWEEFQAAMLMFDAPAQNVVYADVEGNIGYIMTGLLPLRADGHTGKLPVDGTTDAPVWGGTVDPSENPRLFNPPAGFILSANNAVIEDFPYKIADVYSYGFRAARIETLLEAVDQHSMASMMDIQFDNHFNAADWILPTLQTMNFEDESLAEVVAWLGEWDLQADADSPHAALFNVFWRYLMRYGLDELPVYEVAHSSYLLQSMWGKPHLLWNEGGAMGAADPQPIVERALLKAVEETTTLLGEDRASWRWGDLHQAAHYNLALDALPDDADIADFEELLNRSVAAGGWGDAVNATDWSVTSDHFEVDSLPSMRMILDFSNFDQSQMVLPIGQSGHAESQHYDDHMQLWATGGYYQHNFSVDAVQENAEMMWVFHP